jgi:hypothetical protein
MAQKEKPPARVKARKGQGTQSKPNEGSKVTTKANIPLDSPHTEHVKAAPPITAAMLKTGTDTALDFLQRWAPEGPWALTAIKPDKKSIQGKLFRKADFTEMGQWIKDRNGKYNMYFSVNLVMRDFDRKASREDIGCMVALHVDIDARPPNPELSADEIAAHNQAEFARIYELLTTKLPQGVPAPSVITFSGGGYQAFWKLVEPVPIDGDNAKYEDAKLYNVQLERIFEGDNCHNVDRIMRLPGTVNIPDAKKLKKGRKATLAVVKGFAADVAYDLDKFVKANPVQLANEPGRAGGSTKDEIKIGAAFRRLADVSDLDEWNVPERIKVIIVQGHHPEETKEDNTRSSWLFDVVCNLYRCKVPDDLVYGIITDKDYGISASVLDTGTNAEKYALRQMARAKEDIIDPWLCKLNDKHFIIGNDGGKCRVFEEVEDPVLKRAHLTRQSFDDFRNRYMNKYVRVGTDSDNKPVWAPVGKWWLNHTNRKEFERIVFAPGMEVPDAYNMWRGYAFRSIPGDKHLGFLAHVRENLCNGNDEYYRYIVGWMARAVQFPGEQGHVAVVLRGERGVGKSFFAKQFGALFGRHYLQVTQPSHLVGNFNSHLRDCVVLFADEAFVAEDPKHGKILNAITTEDMIMIERKGVDVVSAPNFTHLIMAANDPHVISAADDERRFFALEVGSSRKKDLAYFEGLQNELTNGGYENLLHYLLTYDLSSFEVRAVPDTDALLKQKAHTRARWKNVLIEMAETGVTPDHDGWKRNGQADWISTSGVLEAAGEKAGNKSLQMQVNEVLEKLVDEGWTANVKCFCEDPKPPIPIGQNSGLPTLRIRRVQRRMSQLKPLAQVRMILERSGLIGAWDPTVTDWRLRGDEEAIGDAGGRPPF